MIRSIPAMPGDDELLARIRGEYQEMPGLRLTLAQASRLFAIDRAVCLALLDRLVAERSIHRTHDGAYVGLPSASPAAAKATLSSARRRSRTSAARRA